MRVRAEKRERPFIKKGTFVVESELNEDSEITRSDFYAQNGWFQSQTYS
jgi:hypothetical protein